MPAEVTTSVPAEPPAAAPQDEPPEPLRVGLIYNLKRIVPLHDGTNDDEAEYDSESTVAAIADAIASHGHTVVRIEADRDFFAAISGAKIDVAFNLAEGMHGRARESMVPAVLDALGIPYSGSDAATMVLCLDKALAKLVVSNAGVRTARSQVMRSASEPLREGMQFPLLAKPVAEGSSKGVTSASVVHDEAALRDVVGEMVARYAQGVLVEQYLSGREFTVAVLDAPERRALPAMEVVFTETAGEFPVYSFAHKQAFCDEVRYEVPAKVSDELAAEIASAAIGAFEALGCRDVARIDLRMGADGQVYFIECNPLPGLTPGWSDLCLIAEACGMTYAEVIGQILAPAITRRTAALGQDHQ